jgi:uncharacterized membrane protein YheB (UPF0754 family)
LPLPGRATLCGSGESAPLSGLGDDRRGRSAAGPSARGTFTETTGSTDAALDPVLLQVLLTVFFGSIAGGTTNAIAVWMLFHPYEPPRLFGLRFRLMQGAIPKNKGRLAAAMGRTVGNKLLTSEDLARTVAEPGFREAFEGKLSEFVHSLFDMQIGSVSEMLPPEVVAELRGVLEDVTEQQLERLGEYLGSEDFHETARGWAERLADEVRDRPLSQLLTPERENALADAADRWIAEAVEGQGMEEALGDYVDRGTARFLVPGRAFQDLLPIGLVAAVERAIAGYLPIALERLAGLLEDPYAKRRVKVVLHELLDRFMSDLKFHQRLVAAFIITPETVDRVLKAVEEEGAAKIAELLSDPEVRDAMARGVNSAIVDFLEKPVVSVLGGPEDPSVLEAKQTVTSWALSVARDEQTRAFLVDKLRTTLASADRRTWGDIFRHLPPEKGADAIVSALRSDRAREFYDDAAGRLIDFVLNRRIGRLADRLPPDAPERFERAIVAPFWSWIQEQVPSIAQRIDIAGRVEQKILEFPTEQVEQLIKGVTERELKLIVRLGYVLGAMIGLISAGIAITFG